MQDIVFSDEEGEASGRSEGEEEEAGSAGGGYFPPPPPASAFPPATFPAPPVAGLGSTAPQAPLGVAQPPPQEPPAQAPPQEAPQMLHAAPHVNGHPQPHDDSVARQFVAAVQG